MSRDSLQSRVSSAAEAALARSKTVSPIDVLNGIGWLPANRIDEWRQGRLGHLEQALSARPDRIAKVMTALRRWAEDNGLRPVEVPYVSATRDRARLRFTADGD